MYIEKCREERNNCINRYVESSVVELLVRIAFISAFFVARHQPFFKC